MTETVQKYKIIYTFIRPCPLRRVMSEFILDVTGMTCINCERLVEEELEFLCNVSGVTANATKDTVRVEAPPSAVDEVQEAIEDLGFGLEH